MDLHPTPFPGKQRPSSVKNPPKKIDKDRTKSSLQPAPPTRPKRVFGIARNTNIPVEKPIIKPLPAKTCKTLKTLETDTLKISNKIKIDRKKNQHVYFQEPKREISQTIEKKNTDDEGDCTPGSVIKTTSDRTPYQTAENCSKCRFDKLETSAYWLNQIRIAESSGKHFVAAAFFRLALECNAQPFRSIRSELKHYMVRHKSATFDTWNDLNQLYGLSNDQFNVDSLDAVLVEKENSESLSQEIPNPDLLKDDCFEYDIVENPSSKLEKMCSELTYATNLTLAIGDASTEDFVDVKAMENSLKHSAIKNKNVSGKKSCHEKSNTTPRSGGSSSRSAFGSEIKHDTSKLSNQHNENKNEASPCSSDSARLKDAVK